MAVGTAKRSANDVAAEEVLITHIFDAPRELVFEAWTDPEHLKRWFAPRGCTTDFARIDIRPGGSFHSCVRTPDGHECWCLGVYREIVAPERIVFSMTTADANGEPVEPAHVGMDPEWPKETVVTVTLTAHGAKTKLTLHQTVHETVAKRTGAHPGWIDMLDRLAETLVRD